MKVTDHAVLPDVHTHWIVTADEKVVVIINGKRYLTSRLGICANGTKDMCLYKNKNNETYVDSIFNISDSDVVLARYDKDLLFVWFDEPYPFDNQVLYFEIDNDSMGEFVNFLTEHYGYERGEDYDAYLGGKYNEGEKNE